MTAVAPRTATLFDERRRGSTWQQASVGAMGIVLALVLVIGQISVATTAGIQHNLHANIQRLKDGNATMREIVEKAAPTVLMEKVVADQAVALDHTGQTLQLLNEEMAALGETTLSLEATVTAMSDTSAGLATGVEGMASDTSKIVDLLGPLPDATTRTHKQLGRISGDSKAINGELDSISHKMEGYGLPHARCVKGKCQS